MKIDAHSWVSPNHGPRPGPPDSIVVHTGEGPTARSDLITLTSRKAKVSSHYYVDRTGTIFQLVNLSREAWHAGKCDYAGRVNWNGLSIGIETEHRKGQDWPVVQKQALAALCRMLIRTYSIPQSMVVAHRWIAVPRWPWPRKQDPSDWPNWSLRAWIAALYDLPPPDIRDFKIKLTTLPWAVVRKDPTRAAPKQAILRPGEPFVGSLTIGAPYNHDPRWIKRLPELGGGYVWYGLVDLAS